MFQICALAVAQLPPLLLRPPSFHLLQSCLRLARSAISPVRWVLVFSSVRSQKQNNPRKLYEHRWSWGIGIDIGCWRNSHYDRGSGLQRTV
ncbi:hypothetical protein GALMADRAFT_1049178 [Galerina marginata CBS 339.88]|uniref:Uncharacterized protein n=1 Tax=Galerina marginata (strain CBS 339.88) TaxID=685588 RepID=A0A067SBF6_GALM3|nr:hypothetical protein GALMADRAFT_1049178 [Galerina marginata CBS 339.88]